jgi:hypothetical protein
VETKDALERLAGMIEQARTMPMSASCIVNRAEVLAERDRVIDSGRAEAERLIDRTRAEQRRLMAQTTVTQEAEAEAAAIIEAARRQAQDAKAEADDYVDSKLANFEVVLTRTLQAVGKGRERLRGLADGELSSSLDPGPVDDRADTAPFGRGAGV